jgi:hypothetical protein
LVRPNLTISDKITADHRGSDPSYRIKVINRGRRSAIDIKAELHLVQPVSAPGPGGGGLFLVTQLHYGIART